VGDDERQQMQQQQQQLGPVTTRKQPLAPAVESSVTHDERLQISTVKERSQVK